MQNSLEQLLLQNIERVLDKVDELNERVIRIEVNVEKNTKDLEEHIEGVKQTRELIKQHEAKDVTAFKSMDDRITELEQPSKVKSYLKKGFIGLGTLAAAAYSIYSLVSYILKNPLF